MGEHLLVGRFAVRGDRGEERALEPAPVLVRAFEVEVCGVRDPLPLADDASPGGAAVEPHVHRVPALGPHVRLFLERLGEQVHLVHLVPGVTPVGAHNLLHVGDRLLRHEGVTGFFVVEYRDRDTPGALPRDAPVVTGCRHRTDTVLAECWGPRHLVNGLHGAVPESVDGRKPLLGATEDGRLLRAPVVRVLVRVRLLFQQRPDFLQRLHHSRVAITKHVLADEGLARLSCKAPAVVHWGKEIQSILEPRRVIFLSMSGRRVYEARAALRGDVLPSDHHRRGALIQGVLVCRALRELRTREAHYGDQC
mmetsp:Transcript_37489/g.50733  ORF Transcript_37489/g.50733 Transcript_37489/m.50733 type:complete len:308 (+) Transcript_37489:1405-2328(+)